MNTAQLQAFCSQKEKLYKVNKKRSGKLCTNFADTFQQESAYNNCKCPRFSYECLTKSTLIKSKTTYIQALNVLLKTNKVIQSSQP